MSTAPLPPSLAAALDALRAGRPVLVMDDADRENEGDVILAAQTVTPEWMGWTIRHTSGFICAPMPNDWADRLALPLMARDNQDPFRTAYTITVDAAVGVSTGISAGDRARTVQVLADPEAGPADLTRPGHVIPLRAHEGGVLQRTGHTEAAVDLCRLAGLTPVGALAELVDDSGEMLRADGVEALAAQFELPVLTIAELASWRARHDRVQQVTSARLPTEHGTFTAHGYRDLLTGAEHLALVPARGLGEDPLVRVHSECLTGDAFGSRRCDCGPQLQDAMGRVAQQGGVVIYLRGHEGRGIGLLDKLRAYAAQDEGMDTVEAQVHLGLPVDSREYGAATAVLHELGVTRLRLITHNPAKVTALERAGITVSAVLPSQGQPSPESIAYLSTKRTKMGHLLPSDPTPHPSTPRRHA